MSKDGARSGARAITDVVPELARRFLVAPAPPARLPTFRALAHEHRSSLASIHAAMSRLEASGAFEVETRGRLGAFLVARSIGRLWAAAENGPLVVSLPLASSLRYEALATAIKQILTGIGLEVFLIFVRGSRQRLEAVRAGRCHLAVMSSFAASALVSPGDQVVAELAPDSYNTGHRVFYTAAESGRSPLRVIVDRHSADQQLLTALEFPGAGVEQVPAMTAQIIRLLRGGQADAAVWTIDEMQAARQRGIHDRPLRAEVRDKVGDRDTRAVLVARATDAELMRALTRQLDPSEVTRIQLDVMTGQLVPEY